MSTPRAAPPTPCSLVHDLGAIGGGGEVRGVRQRGAVLAELKGVHPLARIRLPPLDPAGGDGRAQGMTCRTGAAGAVPRQRPARPACGSGSTAAPARRAAAQARQANRRSRAPWSHAHRRQGAPEAVRVTRPLCEPLRLSRRPCTTSSPLQGYVSTTSMIPPALSVVRKCSSVSWICWLIRRGAGRGGLAAVCAGHGPPAPRCRRQPPAYPGAPPAPAAASWPDGTALRGRKGRAEGRNGAHVRGARASAAH